LEEVIVEEVVSGWRWDRRDGSIYHFDPSGRLEKIIRNGTEVSLVYDAEIRLITVQDSSTGRQLDFQYNVQGFLEKIVGPATSAVPSGVWVTFGYDANQNPISVTYADGSGFDYAYGDPNDAHNVTEKKDKSGKKRTSQVISSHPGPMTKGIAPSITTPGTVGEEASITSPTTRPSTQMLTEIRGSIKSGPGRGISSFPRSRGKVSVLPAAAKWLEKSMTAIFGLRKSNTSTDGSINTPILMPTVMPAQSSGDPVQTMRR
jgi:hypothetical protein